jgi:hypothetical protein
MPDFTQAELDDFCRPARQRLADSYRSGSPAELTETYRAIVAAIRDIADLYSAWSAATLGWLRERHGFAAVAAVLPVHELLPGGPETGLTEPEMTIVRSVLRGEDDTQTARIVFARSEEELLTAWEEIHAACDRAEILRRDSATALLSVVHDRYGPEALEDSLRYAAELIWLPRMTADLRYAPRDRLRNWAVKMATGHNGTVSAREEPDHWVITLDPCGSCGRQILAGRYRPPWNFSVVTDGYKVGFLRPDITVYQAHLAVAHTMVPIERTGAPWPAMSCAGLAAGPCEIVLYRDPAQTDARYYEQVGAVKPATAPSPSVPPVRG